MAEQKKPLLDPKTRYRLELMVIILVITVIANILVYWLNRRYEERQMREFNRSEQLSP
jgi:hypothetical protein